MYTICFRVVKLLPMLVWANSRSIWAMYDLRSSSAPFIDASSPGSRVSKSNSSSLSKHSKSSSSRSSESDSGGLGPTPQHRKSHLMKKISDYTSQKAQNIICRKEPIYTGKLLHKNHFQKMVLLADIGRKVHRLTWKIRLKKKKVISIN